MSELKNNKDEIIIIGNKGSKIKSRRGMRNFNNFRNMRNFFSSFRQDPRVNKLFKNPIALLVGINTSLYVLIPIT